MFMDFLESADAIFWGYIGFSLILSLGCYLTFKTQFFQLRAFPYVIRTFFQEVCERKTCKRGLHPIRAFFASVGGMLGVGNVVGIVTAVQLGGPGALLWVWVAGFAGTLIKYSEIYLGLKTRVKNEQQGYDGGPMFFLKQAFGNRWISIVVCVLLCIYAAEIYQFNVVVDTIAYSWGMHRLAIALCLLSLVLYAGIGGMPRVAKVCSLIMPLFMLIYITMCLYVIGSHYSELPALFMTVLKSAFTGHAAVGGFAGSTILLAIQNGMASASYSADIGIGYDSIIQSESHTVYPERQARMAFFGVCLDNLICTLSIFVVLVTGLWQTPIGSESSPLVQVALAQHFPFVNVLMPSFIFILGYTTLISYFIVGIKCAHYLYPQKGGVLYVMYSACIFTFFAFFDQTHALFVMRVAGALLLMINLAGIYRLRHHINFAREELDASEVSTI